VSHHSALQRAFETLRGADAVCLRGKNPTGCEAAAKLLAWSLYGREGIGLPFAQRALGMPAAYPILNE